jgi:rod shape-determining protein MreC
MRLWEIWSLHPGWGVFPKGLPVGTISSLKGGDEKLFKEIDVMPSVDFSRLEEVLVIQTTDSREIEE